MRHQLTPVVLCGSADATAQPLISLGESGLHVSRIGAGTLGWGDPNSGFPDRYSEVHASPLQTSQTAQGTAEEMMHKVHLVGTAVRGTHLFELLTQCHFRAARLVRRVSAEPGGRVQLL